MSAICELGEGPKMVDSWLISVTGVLIATLWGYLQFEVRRLRDKLESLEERVHAKVEKGELQHLANKQDEAGKELRNEIRERCRDCCAHELYRSTLSRDRAVAPLSGQVADPLLQTTAQTPMTDSSLWETASLSDNTNRELEKIKEKFPEILNKKITT
jgi:hypothetical protein